MHVALQLSSSYTTEATFMQMKLVLQIKREKLSNFSKAVIGHSLDPSSDNQNRLPTIKYQNELRSSILFIP